MQNIENLVSSLDAQVLCALQSFNFSDSPLVWGNELNQIVSDIYVSIVRRTKEDTRVVARGFRREYRTARLLNDLEDLVKRADVLRLMLSAVDLLTARQCRVPRLEPDERSRIRQDIPTLHCTMCSIMERISCWQDEVGAALDTFIMLEELEETLEQLLASLPGTIPNTYISQGKDLIDQLVCIWVERRAIAVQAVGLAPESQELQQLVDHLNDQREDQRSIIGLFCGLITQIIDVPPLHFHREFTARQLSGASWSYRCLCVRRMSINEQMVRLETALDRMMDVVEAGQE